MKLVPYLIDELVSRRTARDDKMACQGGFRRAHCPYMKIMHARYAGKHFEILAHVRRFDHAPTAKGNPNFFGAWACAV